METVTKILEWIVAHPDDIVYCITAYFALIGLFEFIAQHTENKKDDAIVGKIRGASIFLIKLLAKPLKIDVDKINFGK